MIQAIIFDWGGVISSRTNMKHFAEEFAQRHGVNAAELGDIIYQHWKSAKIGAITSEEFWTLIAADAGVSRHAIKQELTNFFGTNEDTIALIHVLKKKYKIGMLTNNLEDWLAEALRKKGVKELFDVILSSHTSRKAKPDPAFYTEIVEKLALPARACVFIDDKESNLEPAQKIGMKTIHFQDTQKLIHELKKLGIEC